MGKPNNPGLAFNRYFTSDSKNPFEEFKYQERSSVIRNPKGDVVFEMNNVEVESEWSQVATDILAQKYLRKTGVPGNDKNNEGENSIKQVAHRMADCWRSWGEKYNYFSSKNDAQIFYDELVYSIVGQYAAPNSPQWFNTGLFSSYGIKGSAQGHYYVDPDTGQLKKSTSAYERPQPHACFILSVDDDLVNGGGIMDLLVREARIFKYGSGVGTNFSNIRGADEKLSGGGYSSGLMSFLKIGDRAAGAIKSGGTTRRAAKMVSLDLDHPEVMEFIKWKAEEEKKVGVLIAAGYSSDYEGGAYETVSGQNSNNSIRIPNGFFERLEKGEDWDLIARTDGRVVNSIPAKEIWDQLSNAAWVCADPGVQFDTTINEWHTCPEGGKIRASNPCSEYMFIDNTACNLASINLRKFFDSEKLLFDVKGFQHVSRLWTVVLEISVLMAQFPSKEVAKLSYDYRTLGLGYANLGSLLMISGIPYDSDEARAISGAISAIMTGTAYKTSAEMAEFLGAFKEYEKNKKHMLRVIRNHRYAAYNAVDAFEELEIIPKGIEAQHCPDYLMKAACKAWDEAVIFGERHGFRNAQSTVIAPTGTIGLVMDCDTTGVEPDFALVKFKKLSGGGYFKIINQSIPIALKNLGYSKKEIKEITDYAKGTGTLKKAPYINFETLSAKGLTKDEINKIDSTIDSAFELGFAFNVWTLGEETLEKLGFTSEEYNNPNFNFLQSIGYTKEEIIDANDHICGTMTIEGAPNIRDEHLPVFDCASRCGKKGKRFIDAYGHIKMMGSVQPFISGAISKTINLPNETTEKEIQECYELSWKLGLKANALYRDGCKLSQPLSNKSDTKATNDEEATKDKVASNGESKDDKVLKLTPEQVLDAAKEIIQNSEDTTFKRQLSNVVERKKLPAKRRGFTQKSKVGGQAIFVRTGEYGDGTLGEIFIDMHKEGASFRSLMNCFAISVSIGLQYGVPLEEFVSKFTFTRFEPSGNVDHQNIKKATSIVDYLFRLLGFEYLKRNDLVHVLPDEINDDQKDTSKEPPKESSKGGSAEMAYVNEPEIKAIAPVGSTKDQTQEYISNLQADAPTCDNCGHLTIRSGTCYKCLNCGNSLGCS